MFKANLIEDSEFYSRRRIKVIFYFLPAIPIVFLINYNGLPIWVIILALLIYITVLFIGLRNAKKLTALSQERIMELDESTLRVKSKGKVLLLEIHLNTIDKIAISKEYGIPEESMKDIVKEISGKAKKNFIVISNCDLNQRFDFIIESYFMLQQLERVVESWVKRGYLIDRV